MSLLAILCIALSVRFGVTFPWARTIKTLIGADWLLLSAASLANILSLVAKASAWYLLLRRLGPLRHSTAQAATFVGAAVSSFSVSVSGEAARAQVVNSWDGVSFGSAVASVVVTRVVEATGLLVFLGGALVLVPPWSSARPLGFALIALTVALILGYRVIPWARVRSDASGRRHEAIIRMVDSAGRGGLAGAVALAASSWVAQWAAYHWTIAATHAVVTPAVSLTTLIASNIGGILRLTPGNIGVLQGSLMLVMREFGIPPANALAAGLALQAVQVLPILAIGLAIAGRQGLRGLATARG